MSDTRDAAPRFRRHTREVRAAMLVEAGWKVLAEGGIRAFTIDNICKAAGASRGLVTHHFGGKEGLLTAVYAAAYEPLLGALEPKGKAPLSLPEMMDVLFSPANYSTDSLNVWLAIWGEIATNGPLMAEHRALYARYRDQVARAVAEQAAANGRVVDAGELAVLVISLVDGLWLELCLDPGHLTAERARAACLRLIEPVIGPVALGAGGAGR